eukprot:SAG25_NODE_354_length_9250_cov_2.824281_1_plen_306_part_00
MQLAEISDARPDLCRVVQAACSRTQAAKNLFSRAATCFTWRRGDRVYLTECTAIFRRNTDAATSYIVEVLTGKGTGRGAEMRVKVSMRTQALAAPAADLYSAGVYSASQGSASAAVAAVGASAALGASTAAPEASTAATAASAAAATAPEASAAAPEASAATAEASTTAPEASAATPEASAAAATPEASATTPEASAATAPEASAAVAVAGAYSEASAYPEASASYPAYSVPEWSTQDDDAAEHWAQMGLPEPRRDPVPQWARSDSATQPDTLATEPVVGPAAAAAAAAVGGPTFSVVSRCTTVL